MAIDYDLTVSPVLTEQEALDCVADHLACDRRYNDPDAVARSNELRVGALRAATDHALEMSELLGGVAETLKIIFHPSKFLTEAADARVFADMVGTAVRFFEDFPEAKGTFTLQGEESFVQRLVWR
ncbi:SitI3 family protein [Glycomyces sp. NPDC049804]|uniref:SitI3 family protein n=1 Tax=Glycomyces sp. NPDC049804 TaxID=3154363 RepID=UPI00343CEF96